MKHYEDEFQWELDTPWYELDDKTIDLLFAADMLQEYKLSIRQCCAETLVARTTLHNFINGSLRSISYELYRLCRIQLDWNKNHISYFMKKKF